MDVVASDSVVVAGIGASDLGYSARLAREVSLRAPPARSVDLKGLHESRPPF